MGKAKRMAKPRPAEGHERLRLAVLELKAADSGLNRANAWVKVNNALAEGHAGKQRPRSGGVAVWAAPKGHDARAMRDLFTDIVREEMGIATLEVKNWDSLDFHEVSVAALAKALARAFAAGAAAAAPEE